MMMPIFISSCAYVPEEWSLEDSLAFFTEKEEEIAEPVVIHSDFSPEINNFLSTSKEGDNQLFITSPWGEDALITVEKLYFSASGRTCRNITITLEHTHIKNLACQAGKQRWVVIRPVTKPHQVK